ncbi:MAG: hypothetical protein KAJ28_03655 [Flavobacteriaceae bacterium]|nr:hypothetical protein [Flavobacteriaceae bacterium]
MIKFFRKIRQQMINENKTSKYLKYAIGEIVFVVIGILIALQINTWNENRKAKHEETKILTVLQADFKVSKARIEETMVSQQRVLDYSKRLMQIHDSEEEFKNGDSLSIMINSGALSWWRAEPVTGAYNAMISAREIDLIQKKIYVTF